MNKEAGSHVKVLLAEDQMVTLEGLENWFSKVVDIEIVGKAQNSNDAINLAQSLSPEVVLLSLHLPGQYGIEEIFFELKKANTKIVVFSAEERPAVVKLAMSRGSSAFLAKSENLDQVVHVIKSVASGSTGYISPMLRMQQIEIFSPGEEDVLKVLASGMKYEQIGEVRNTSPHTVRKQCDRLQQKLKLTSREALIVWAVENGYGASPNTNKIHNP